MFQPREPLRVCWHQRSQAHRRDGAGIWAAGLCETDRRGVSGPGTPSLGQSQLRGQSTRLSGGGGAQEQPLGSSRGAWVESAEAAVGLGHRAGVRRGSGGSSRDRGFGRPVFCQARRP